MELNIAGAFIDDLSTKGVACVTRDGAASAAADFIHLCCFYAVFTLCMCQGRSISMSMLIMQIRSA